MLHALAFVVLDVGTRAPGRLLADLALGLRSVRVFLKGMGRFFLGIALLFAGALLVLSQTVGDIKTEFFTLETGAIVAGLLIEMLVGEPIRGARQGR